MLVNAYVGTEGELTEILVAVCTRIAPHPSWVATELSGTENRASLKLVRIALFLVPVFWRCYSVINQNNSTSQLCHLHIL
jgi:hypothetical protein